MGALHDPGRAGLSGARIWQRPALRLYHTQLHYDDAITLARSLKGPGQRSRPYPTAWG